MNETRPRGLSGRRVERLLSRAKADRSVATRLDRLSGLLLGRPYEANGLVGSRDVPEVFCASVERFDCVTFLESVLALARASDVDGFVDELRRLRYDGGRVEWTRRHHYVTGWIRANARVGVVRRVPPGAGATTKDRRLDCVPGLPPRRERFTCVPKARLKDLAPRLRTGDLLFFVSTRRDLDVFHGGLVVRVGDRLRLRHAARSQGGVVEQDLPELVKAHRMAGILVVRPVEEEAA